MRQESSPRFHEERTKFRLRFTCDHCSYFEEQSARCTHGYPNAEHRSDQPSEALMFCKEFELR